MSWASKVVVLGLLTGIACLVATGLPFAFSWEEDIGLDLLFRLRGSRPVADYLDLPARPEKWPRNLHARLTDTLARAGASVIAFDIFFDEARTCFAAFQVRHRGTGCEAG